MHIGNLRTALAAWLAARSSGGRIVLRIEDLDTPRVRPGSEKSIVDDFRWLGLDWDEGPDEGGHAGPYRQSERQAHYRDAIERLRSAGLAYACECSRAEVASSAPHGIDGAPVYPGTCRAKSSDLVIERAVLRGRNAAWRFRLPGGAMEWTDSVYGPRSETSSSVAGDMVIARSDGIYAYQLAVVVDDAAMGITDVWRGADLLDSTGRQIHLHRALGHEPPRFGHVPLVLREVDGRKLSKRDRPPAVEDVRLGGLAPERLTAILARSLGLESPEQARPADLIPCWNAQKIVRESGTVDTGPD